MNFNEVKEVISLFDNSTLTYMNLKLDNCSIAMDKRNTIVEGRDNIKEEKVITRATESLVLNSDAEEDVVSDVKEEKKEGRYITSPIVGCFYSSSSPDKESFVKVGSKIKTGDTVCIIESMKLMNEIESDMSGEIAEVLVENGAMVEFGQELFRVI